MLVPPNFKSRKKCSVFSKNFPKENSPLTHIRQLSTNYLTSSLYMETLSVCSSKSCPWFKGCVKNMATKSLISKMVRRNLIQKTCSPLRLDAIIWMKKRSRANTSLSRKEHILAKSSLPQPMRPTRMLERTPPTYDTPWQHLTNFPFNWIQSC